MTGVTGVTWRTETEEEEKEKEREGEMEKGKKFMRAGGRTNQR